MRVENAEFTRFDKTGEWKSSEHRIYLRIISHSTYEYIQVRRNHNELWKISAHVLLIDSMDLRS